MASRTFYVLIVCTGNSARSRLAETLLNQISSKAGIEVQAYSADSRPRFNMHAGALKALKKNGTNNVILRTRIRDKLARSVAPRMDVAITVCNSSGGENESIGPDTPAKVHWGLDDPSVVTRSSADADAVFEKTFDELNDLIERLVEVAAICANRDVLQVRLQELDLAAA